MDKQKKTYVDWLVIIIFTLIILAGIFWTYDKVRWKTDYGCERWEPTSREEWVKGVNCILYECKDLNKGEKPLIQQCVCEKTGEPAKRYCNSYYKIKRYRWGYMADPLELDEIIVEAGNRTVGEIVRFNITT